VTNVSKGNRKYSPFETKDRDNQPHHHFSARSSQTRYRPRPERPLQRGCTTSTLLIPDLISQSETLCFVQPPKMALSAPHLHASAHRDEGEKGNLPPDVMDPELR
jgi:hypothetical protein